MRVVGGRLKGRNLASPSSRDIRPTADRLREAVFNILIHAYDDPIEGARVLDLFAGTGALGIEAVSRGARFALFVDNGTEARALLRNNVEALGLGGVTKVFRRDATNLGPAHPVEPFSLVFLDPPYRMKLAEKACISLRDGGWLTQARCSWWKRPRRRNSPRRRDLRSWSGAPMTTPSSYSCARPRDDEDRVTSARTASRCPTASIRHRSGGRDCTGRSSACLPSRAAARSFPRA